MVLNDGGSFVRIELDTQAVEPMNQDQRFKIISEGQRIGVTQVCHKYGLSRSIYYRWLSRYKKQGMSGLATPKRTSPPVNKTSEAMTSLILSCIKTYPTYGPRELMYRIHEMGYKLSESAIYNVMVRHHLSTRKDRLKYASKRIALSSPPSLNVSVCEQEPCWLIWITPYGKFNHLGPIYEYTIFDYQTHIACSRLYQRLSVDCFEDLLTAVAIPVAQSIHLSPHHFCFMHDLDVPIIKKQSIHEGIEHSLSSNNLEGQMHVVTTPSQFPSAFLKRNTYTQAILSFLLPHFHQTQSLDQLKLSLQHYIRDYNLTQKQTFHLGEMSPLEFHSQIHHVDPILPLWAYIDRPYDEVNV